LHEHRLVTTTLNPVDAWRAQHRVVRATCP
jgi:hypothetical protein